jgi:hypothetical protein
MEIPVVFKDAMNQSAAPDWMGCGTSISMNNENAKGRPCMSAACPVETGMYK